MVVVASEAATVDDTVEDAKEDAVESGDDAAESPSLFFLPAFRNDLTNPGPPPISLRSSPSPCSSSSSFTAP